ncbi:MAG TPA: winged helix-turn-helix transcriptional regulator [Chitinophagaceae bacterium]|jgi:Lrp/AsnC family leucine-responsive transcriptional regulator|nr:winged helix-turn-helix transcriptional regulator [Chitinophagaceae bacterium]
MLKTLNNKALDDLNKNILKELSQNARITTAEIGRRIGLSAPAVGERIQKLEEMGYIKGYRAILDFDKIGLTIQAFIHYKVTGLKHAEMTKLISCIPEVVEWHTITGNASVILKIATSSRQELADIIVKLEEYGETSTSLILEGSTVSKYFE